MYFHCTAFALLTDSCMCCFGLGFEDVFICCLRHSRLSLLPCSRAEQLLQDTLEDAGFLYEKARVLGDIEKTCRV